MIDGVTRADSRILPSKNFPCQTDARLDGPLVELNAHPPVGVDTRNLLVAVRARRAIVDELEVSLAILSRGHLAPSSCDGRERTAGRSCRTTTSVASVPAVRGEGTCY